MLSPAEAARLILEHVRPLETMRRPLREALDLVLAEDVTSPIDLPAWDNSAMDGYAVRSADVTGASPERTVTLRVIETVPAGRFPERALGPGEVTRIFTGAPLPTGADGVIRQEDTELLPDGRVAVRNDRDSGRNVRPRGEDIRAGAVALARGAALGPAQLGVLASIAHGTPLVHRPPRVAFMGSGDEIVDLDRADEILAGKKIATSNSYTLHGMIRRAGGTPLDLGVARDTKDSLREHVAGAHDADLLVTTAGVSVGEHDLVREVLTALGCDIKLWRIRMRPGAPLGFGLLDGRPWIGLPGNPVSTMVTFELFVRPVIRRLLGHALPFRRTVAVCVAEPITLGPKLRHYLRAIVAPQVADGALAARLTGPQGSGILTSMARANALLRFVGGIDQMAPGTALVTQLVNEGAYLAVVGVAITGLSQLRRTQGELHQLATQDTLTTVLNARAFSQELGQELGRNRRYGRPLALIYLDLDDFKRVNDAHGHATGDAVLRLVADAMRSAVRQADVVGRLGGDEFAVLMPETDGTVANAAAARLASSIRTVFRGTPSVTASIGVVSWTGGSTDSDDVLRKADAAMYEAKRAGKDRGVQVAI